MPSAEGKRFLDSQGREILNDSLGKILLTDGTSDCDCCTDCCIVNLLPTIYIGKFTGLATCGCISWTNIVSGEITSSRINSLSEVNDAIFIFHRVLGYAGVCFFVTSTDTLSSYAGGECEGSGEEFPLWIFSMIGTTWPPPLNQTIFLEIAANTLRGVQNSFNSTRELSLCTDSFGNTHEIYNDLATTENEITDCSSGFHAFSGGNFEIIDTISDSVVFYGEVDLGNPDGASGDGIEIATDATFINFNVNYLSLNFDGNAHSGTINFKTINLCDRYFDQSNGNLIQPDAPGGEWYMTPDILNYYPPNFITINSATTNGIGGGSFTFDMPENNDPAGNPRFIRVAINDAIFQIFQYNINSSNLS